MFNVDLVCMCGLYGLGRKLEFLEAQPYANHAAALLCVCPTQFRLGSGTSVNVDSVTDFAAVDLEAVRV